MTLELEKGYVAYPTIEKLDRKQFYLYHLLAPLGFNPVQVSNLLMCIKKKQVGKVFIGKDWTIFVDREQFEITRGIEKEDSTAYHIDKNTSVMYDPIHLEFQRFLNEEYNAPFKSKNEEVVDRSKLVYPLTVRKWADGDKMQPLGMQGKKKISDILIDLKVLTFYENIKKNSGIIKAYPRKR